MVVVDEAFRASRLMTPQIEWDPAFDDIPTDELRILKTYWDSLRGADAIPALRDFDPIQLRSILGYLMLIDAVDGGADFQYRVFGTWIARETGYDMTGKRMSSLPTRPALAAFLMAGYRAVLSKPRPLLTRHHTPPEEGAPYWVRLILPLRDANGDVTRFLVGNKPHQMIGGTIPSPG